MFKIKIGGTSVYNYQTLSFEVEMCANNEQEMLEFLKKYNKLGEGLQHANYNKLVATYPKGSTISKRFPTRTTRPQYSAPIAQGSNLPTQKQLKYAQDLGIDINQNWTKETLRAALLALKGSPPIDQSQQTNPLNNIEWPWE